MTADLISSHVPGSPKDFLNTALVRTFLMLCIRHASGWEALTNGPLAQKVRLHRSGFKEPNTKVMACLFAPHTFACQPITGDQTEVDVS